ncbi:MAG: hypothetical protein A2Z88_08300 [Omnitrophica WOR_2 bacterium GWA2_47_8]|nr:MAG: hypothetical protein A2Z88_08300 [Omnitrophica WOR_2 bacterium GWA2_47_8]
MKINHLILWSLMIAIPHSAYAANIAGKVIFEGAAPEGKQVDLSADPNCAALHPDGLLAEEVTVNPNATLKNVFVYVKKGLEGQTFSPPEEPVILDQKGCWYEPHVFGIQVNQPLEILNSDSTLHNVHALPAENKEFNLGMPIQGMKVKKIFAKPEIMVKFKCDVHPWMASYAGVLEHPFFSVTNEEGIFEIKGLPAGSYVIETWHEKYGIQSQNVSLAAADASASAEFKYQP